MEEKNGDWTIRGTTRIFGNEFFQVFEDDVVQPDGQESEYATIHFRPGVAILPVDGKGCVYLTFQFRYALGRENIEVVSGGYGGDEDVLEAARRELKEELGIEAAEWTSLGRIESITSITNARSDLFLARGLSFKEAEREGTEKISPIKMRLEEAVEKVLSGEITHGETCVLVLKAHLGNKKTTAVGT